MLVDTGAAFHSLVEQLASRCLVELQQEGWAVIIDGETVTWSVSETAAHNLAIKLIEHGW